MRRRRPQLLCFGDSNTHGTLPMEHADDRRRLTRRHRWPGVLHSVLGHNWRVTEEGLPGRTTVHDDPIEGRHRNGLRFLQGLLETHRPVDIVVIMLGTNDLKARFAVSATEIATGLGHLVDVVVRSDAGPNGNPPAVVLVAPPPVLETGIFAEMFRGAGDKSANLSQAIRDMADRKGTGFIDAGLHAESDPLDGIHLSRQGHHDLGQAIGRYLSPMLETYES